MDEFKLRIAGICLGNHCFTIDCDKEFFEIANISELEDGLLKLQIKMEKTETMLNLKFHFKGDITALCDRCLDPVTLPLDFHEQLVVKLVQYVDEKTSETDDAVWVINENQYELDIFHFVYESIRLALPLKIAHPDDESGNSTCNAEVLEIMKKFTHSHSEIDSKWEGLKKIKFD